jgi:hypothetical protein
MGFDIYGINAKSEKGEYFRSSVWGWRPLADYVLEHVEIPEAEHQYWHSNDGQKVSEETALKIATVLNEKLQSGAVKQYEEEYTKELEALPLVTCGLCKGSGKRNDEFVQGTCNGCSGTGKTKDWRMHYPFSEEYVREFAEFCEESGGFTIC